MKRRHFLLASLAGLASPASALSTTPRQTAGPFYPDVKPEDDDSDLTRVKGQSQAAKGEITRLSGRILDSRGNPIPEARMEIWQCDANGRYLHSGDSGGKPRDPGFQGFGHAVTDASGQYGFRTIRPVVYPGRTPHIHVAVFTGWDDPFVTQLYIKDDPHNARDFLFGRIPDAKKPLLQAEFKPSTAAGIRFDAEFNIILAGENGTPKA